MNSTVSGVFEDIKFKVSEGYKQNWSFPVSALLAVSVSILVQAFWNFKLKVLKYQWNFRPHATVISKFGETPNLCTEPENVGEK